MAHLSGSRSEIAKDDKEFTVCHQKATWTRYMLPGSQGESLTRVPLCSPFEGPLPHLGEFSSGFQTVLPLPIPIEFGGGEDLCFLVD